MSQNALNYPSFDGSILEGVPGDKQGQHIIEWLSDLDVELRKGSREEGPVQVFVASEVDKIIQFVNGAKEVSDVASKALRTNINMVLTTVYSAEEAKGLFDLGNTLLGFLTSKKSDKITIEVKQ